MSSQVIQRTLGRFAGSSARAADRAGPSKHTVSSASSSRRVNTVIPRERSCSGWKVLRHSSESREGMKYTGVRGGREDGEERLLVLKHRSGATGWAEITLKVRSSLPRGRPMKN